MAFGDRVIDVTDPGGGLTPLVPGPGNGAANSLALQAIFNQFLTNNPNAGLGAAMAIYFPPGIFELSSTINIPHANSFYVFGGGGMAKGLRNLNGGFGAFTVLRWTGRSAGPMFAIGDTDGMVWERINFDGILGPDRNAGVPGAGLDVLIRFDAQTGGFFHEFRNCTFFNAQRLFFCRESSKSGPAEITFHKCLFNCGEMAEHQWDSHAFYADENQTVNCLFGNCEFNNCGICVSVNSAGRVIMRDTTIATCGLLLEVGEGSQNVDGHLIDNVHVDMAFLRCNYYKSTNPNTTYGNVVISQVKPGSLDAKDQNTKEFIIVNDFHGKEITLANPLRIREGDRMGFVDNNHRDLLLDETAVEVRVGNANVNYTLHAPLESLDPRVQAAYASGTLRAIHGECLITSVGSDQITLRDSFLTAAQMQAGRLARLTYSNYSTGRAPRFKVIDCTGFVPTAFDAAGLEALLKKSGTVWWKFEDVTPWGTAMAPLTVGNYGV